MKRREGSGYRSSEIVGGELFDRVESPITCGEVKCYGGGTAIRCMTCISPRLAPILTLPTFAIYGVGLIC